MPSMVNSKRNYLSDCGSNGALSSNVLVLQVHRLPHVVAQDAIFWRWRRMRTSSRGSLADEKSHPSAQFSRRSSGRLCALDLDGVHVEPMVFTRNIRPSK